MQGSMDIIGMLVDIYGSKDLFLNEYRALLSDKLLALTSYQIDNEVHNVELLKLRFGEGSLHNCEVMLKDLSDSKRLDNYVHSQSDKGSLPDTRVEKSPLPHGLSFALPASLLTAAALIPGGSTPRFSPALSGRLCPR